jgi:hypothetical protein
MRFGIGKVSGLPKRNQTLTIYASLYRLSRIDMYDIKLSLLSLAHLKNSRGG